MDVLFDLYYVNKWIIKKFCCIILKIKCIIGKKKILLLIFWYDR